MNKKTGSEQVQIIIAKIVSEIKIYGDTPVIQNRISAETLESLRATQQGWVKQARAPKNVQHCFEGATYFHPAGGYGIPAIWIKQSLINACRYIDGLTMAQMRGSIFVLNDNDPNTQMLKLEGVRYCKEDVVRLSNGNPDLHYRPYFWPWRVTLRVSHDKNLLSPSQLGNLVAKAGLHVGIGDWRPQGKEGTGQFGTFHVRVGADDDKFYAAEYKRMASKIKAEGEIPSEYYTDPNAETKKVE